MSTHQLEAPLRLPPPARLSFEEFLAWLEDDTWAEWVDGEVEIMSPASLPHQLLQGFLECVLSIYATSKGLGVVLGAPFLMRLPEELRRGREPDLLFVATRNRSRLKHTYLDGPADLVVEIISPESILRDRGAKFAEYEMAGVPVYWMLDPIRKRADFYQLGADGRYRAVEPTDGVYRSAVVPGFWLRVEWLWQDPLPPVLAVVKELGIA